MKFLAIIFSVIVMALTVVPCCAYDNCVEEQAEHDPGTPETPCSPFIHCTCSSGICITPSLVFEYLSVTVTVKNNTQYKQFFTSLYSSSIWQPPKYTC